MKTTKTKYDQAISYGRFSSKPQELGDSTRRQEEAFASICKRYNLTAPGKGEQFFDRGLSGYHGDNLKQGGDLYRFLQLVKRAEIRKGSVLVVEHLNRLGRLVPDLAMQLISDIVRAGIPIAVHTPDLWIDLETLSSPMFSVISMYLQIAHAESKEKSQKLSSVWTGKREKGSKVLTKTGSKSLACPSWIEPHGDSYRLADSADTIRKACLMVIAGLGRTEVQRRLGCKVSASVFRSRTLLGDYQPMARTGKNTREKAGEAIQDYYPALLTRNEFLKLQAVLDSRIACKVKRTGDKVSNLLTGLLCNEMGEELTMRVTSKGKRILLPSERTRTEGKRLSVSYDTVETWVLRFVLDLPTDLFQKKETTGDLDKLDEAIASEQDKINLWMEDAQESPMVAKLIVAAEKKMNALKQERETLARTQATDQAEHLQKCQSVIKYMSGLTGDELIAARAKLKAHLQGLVKSIEVSVRAMTEARFVVTTTQGEQLTGDTDLLNWSIYTPERKLVRA